MEIHVYVKLLVIGVKTASGFFQNILRPILNFSWKIEVNNYHVDEVITHIYNVLHVIPAVQTVVEQWAIQMIIFVENMVAITEIVSSFQT
jgi:hypothetical protein